MNNSQQNKGCKKETQENTHESERRRRFFLPSSRQLTYRNLYFCKKLDNVGCNSVGNFGLFSVYGGFQFRQIMAKSIRKDYEYQITQLNLLREKDLVAGVVYSGKDFYPSGRFVQTLRELNISYYSNLSLALRNQWMVKYEDEYRWTNKPIYVGWLISVIEDFRKSMREISKRRYYAKKEALKESSESYSITKHGVSLSITITENGEVNVTITK